MTMVRVTPPTAPLPAPGTRTTQDLPARAGALLDLVAGHVGHRVVTMGLRHRLLDELEGTPGTTPEQLASARGLDPFHVAVWARAAVAAGIVDVVDEQGGLELPAHTADLLLDDTHPGYIGGVFTVMEQPEVFDDFERALATGARRWWDDCSAAFIESVAGTGRPFYRRLVPDGLGRVPDLTDRLERPGVVVDTCCGSGHGLAALATAYPTVELVGVDGDAHSLEVARETVEAAGVSERVTLLHQSLEELSLADRACLVVNNISMHECRDPDEVTRRVHDSLEPGGWFVISDLPFPDSLATLRSVPGRVMSGIQLFEAQIDDQLLPRRAYDDLLGRHAFVDLDHAELTPVHALTWGRRAG